MPEIYISAPTNMPSLPQTCAYCIDDIEEVVPGVVRLIINPALTATCNHVFHNDCIAIVRANSVNCPNCQSAIYDVEDLTQAREDLVQNNSQSVQYFHYERNECISLDELSSAEKYTYASRQYDLLGCLCRDFILLLEELAENFQNERHSLSRKQQLFTMIRAHVELARIDFEHARNTLYFGLTPTPESYENFDLASINSLLEKTDLLENLHNLFHENSEDTEVLQIRVIRLLLDSPLQDLISNDDLQDTSIRILPHCFETPIVDASRVFPTNYWEGRVTRLSSSSDNRMLGGSLASLSRSAGVSLEGNNATSNRSEESYETQGSYGFFSYVYSLWEKICFLFFWE